MNVYMAGPVHNTQDHGMGWRARIAGEYDDIEWVDPTDAYDPTKTYDDIVRDWDGSDIVEKDLELLSECDAVLVHWENVVSVGTPMEIVYAHERFAIPVVVQTTVDDVPIWLEEHADALVETFDEAVDHLERLTTDHTTKTEYLWEAFGV